MEFNLHLLIFCSLISTNFFFKFTEMFAFIQWDFCLYILEKFIFTAFFILIYLDFHLHQLNFSLKFTGFFNVPFDCLSIHFVIL